MESDSKTLVNLLVIFGVIGLVMLISKQRTSQAVMGDGTLYENEKRIELVRGEDGHITELVIHHTIKQNCLEKPPQGILEF